MPPVSVLLFSLISFDSCDFCIHVKAGFSHWRWLKWSSFKTIEQLPLVAVASCCSVKSFTTALHRQQKHPRLSATEIFHDFLWLNLQMADICVLCVSVRLSVAQVFYWSHLSYVWVWSLLLVHCANFWKWFVVPGVLFLLEKIVGIAVSRMGGLYIVEVNLLPSKVSPLIILPHISSLRQQQAGLMSCFSTTPDSKSEATWSRDEDLVTDWSTSFGGWFQFLFS